MRNQPIVKNGRRRPATQAGTRRAAKWIAGGAGVLVSAVAMNGVCAPDPLLDVLIKKGVLTEQEAKDIKAEAEAGQTNAPPSSTSKWKLSAGLKNIELIGDLRARYEYRQAEAPGDGGVILNRYRYALRLGLRGDLFDSFYYGLRLETASNPRSPWVTFGTSSSGIPYTGPYGKSTAGINLGQAFIGWRPGSWGDLTVGKMPNPLYTTAMVWDTDINPEGLAERFTYTVGQVDFFSTFGQFLYADLTPTSASGGVGFNSFVGQTSAEVYQIAWQSGLNYHINADTSAKIAATLYQYAGLKTSGLTSGSSTSPYFGDPFVGEGAYAGPNSSFPVNGYSGYGTSGTIPGNLSLGYPNNQVGLDHLLVVEIPFEFNFKIKELNARAFGDLAYNLDGKARAEAAAAGYATYQANSIPPSTLTGFKPQTADCKAYQFGLAVGNSPLGLVYGSVSKKNTWEARAYWQHVEQYALDPNLMDSDFFEGRGNLEGVYSSVAYSFTDGIIATLRYGYASRINGLLGTGGSNFDIPQVNPLEHYEILQFDLTYRF
jgi:hypothetical protein